MRHYLIALSLPLLLAAIVLMASTPERHPATAGTPAVSIGEVMARF